MLEALTEIMTAEAKVKTEEHSVRRMEVESNEKIALATIEAKERASGKGWDTYHKLQQTRWVGAVVVLVVLLLFSAWAVSAGAKDLVVDLFKIGAGFGAGVFGGFHYGKTRRKNGEEDG